MDSKYSQLTYGFDHHKSCGPKQTNDGTEFTSCEGYGSAEQFENPSNCEEGTPCFDHHNQYKPYSIPEWSPPEELKGESWPLTADCRGKCHIVRWFYYGLLKNKGYSMTQGNDEMDITTEAYKKSYEWYLIDGLATITGDAEGFKYALFTSQYTKCKFTDGSEVKRFSSDQLTAISSASNGNWAIIPDTVPEDCDEETEDYWSCANPCTETDCPALGIDPFTQTESMVLKDDKVCVDVCQRACVCKNGLYRDPNSNKCVTFRLGFRFIKISPKFPAKLHKSETFAQ